MPSALTKGDVVQIQYGTVYMPGVLLDTLGFNGYDPIWWVQIGNSVEAFSEEDILTWNPIVLIKPCECGSKTLGQPGHSPWCSSFVVT